MDRSRVTRIALLSVAAAVVTLAMKGAAWWLTGSVALLSDALETLVNLGASVLALAMLHVAAAPPDDDHRYGHSKAEYFSSGAEGLLVAVAGVSLIWVAVPRLLDPQPLAQTGLGLVLTAAAAAVNFVVARIEAAEGRRSRSIALTADAAHLMADVWTSVAVIAGVALVALTGWGWLDPVIALAVALHILLAGARLLRDSIGGLMDESLPEEDLAVVRGILDAHRREHVDFHAVRTRRAGFRRFISFHVLVPGRWTVQAGHDLLERIEGEIRGALPDSVVFTHLEPIEDPVSHDDDRLDRGPPGD